MTSAERTFSSCGTWWSMLPGGAVLRMEDRLLIVADLHLGKDRSFRAAGLPVPAGSSERTLARLDVILWRTRAKRLLILGDLLHDRSSMTPELADALGRLRRTHGRTEFLLLRGNHDRCAGDPPPHCDFRALDPPFSDGAVIFLHEPSEDLQSLPWVAGHLHPVIRLQGRLGGAMRLPALIAGSRRMLLPAFGDFTGGFLVKPREDDHVFVRAEEGTIVEIPRITTCSTEHNA
jgi:DNA ligase-associated metallophosphoesterase